MISDFVADLRAPTPSAAMEMILPDSREILYTLDEMQVHLLSVMNQKLQHFMRDLRHVEEMVLRASPFRFLGESEIQFKRLKEEYKRVFSYKMERLASPLFELEKKYKQTISFSLEQKEQHLAYLDKKLAISDPKLQYRKGWAQVSQQGKTMRLEDIAVHDTFVLADTRTTLEVQCLGKS